MCSSDDELFLESALNRLVVMQRPSTSFNILQLPATSVNILQRPSPLLEICCQRSHRFASAMPQWKHSRSVKWKWKMEL